MKVAVISDLHLEFSDLVLPGGDVLIISGDAMEAKNFDKTNYIKEDKLTNMRSEGRYARFFTEETAKYREVIYVMGNHEHYGYTFNKTYNHLKENLPDNVHILENETYTIDDVTFVGCTLWTDMNKGDPITLYECSQMMNDYRSVKLLNEEKSVWHRLTPQHTVGVHKNSFDFIKNTVESDPEHKYIVVTHHAPTKLSIKPQYEGDHHINGAYSSDLSNFILDHPQIKIWTHGHTHHLFDYVVGETRVICNPRGYKGYEGRADEFDPEYGFDI